MIRSLEIIQNEEWLDSFDLLLMKNTPRRAQEILELLLNHAAHSGISPNSYAASPYVNTIPPHKEKEIPGDQGLEEKILAINRWNAMAMVARANKKFPGIGGHISTYASSSVLFETGFNHFFRGRDGQIQDLVYYQGHAAPGIYARSFLEGRFTEKDLDGFRREISSENGLASYPHPRSMPGYWNFPTVSMGLSAIQAIYQARFSKYLEKRGLLENNTQKVWAILGDGEMDEPESLGALRIAGRENLDNLIFVISCNLQRLDGPVRGNGKVINELEGVFRGSGWEVIKVIWGHEWDALFAKDTRGVLKNRLSHLPDGQIQRLAAEDGKYIRENLFDDPYLEALVEDLSDEDLENLSWGGHDLRKVYNAYLKASRSIGKPIVIFAQTIKGFNQGEAGEASNVTHKKKKFNENELKYFRDQLNLNLKDKDLKEIPYFHPGKDSPEFKYLKKAREKLGGSIPSRNPEPNPLKRPEEKIFEEFKGGSGDKEVTTTSVMVRILGNLLKDPEVGGRIVPIIPDESRTFGLDALFGREGIYSPEGQLYDPVDKENLLYYNEKETGVIIEEGITEAGSMATFIAAGTSYSNHGLPMVPFYFFYSMFGFQRIGDLIWAAGDARARGFLIGGISGRSSLSGEGLQHTDGQSQVYALAYPSIKAYDPAFAYELAVIIREGMKEMATEEKDLQYYLTITNDKYPMPPMPENAEEGILKGMYLFREGKDDIHLFGSGAIMGEVLKAADILEKKFGLKPHIYSVTGYKQLYDEAMAKETANINHPYEKREVPFIEKVLKGKKGVFIAATDYLKALPMCIANRIPGRYKVLGTDGYGVSDTITTMREYFKVSAKQIALTTLYALAEEGKMKMEDVHKAIPEIENTEK